MSATNFIELRRHVNHEIVCNSYGKKGKTPDNVAIECETCSEVITDYDRE